MTDPTRLDAEQRRTLITLSCGAFASQASVRMCDPMLPQFAAEFGRPLSEAAHVVTSFTIAYGLLQLLHGPMGDRYGKIAVVRIASLAAAATSLACAFALGLGQLVALRFAAGAACAALIPLSLAWIGDSVPYVARQRVLARFMTGSTMGLVFGQVAGGVLADTIGWRLSFVLPAAVFAVVGVILMVDSRKRRERDPPSHPMALPASADAAVGVTRAGESAPRRLGPITFLAPFATVLSIRWARVITLSVFAEGLLVFGAFAFVPSWLHTDFGLPLWQCGLAAAGFGLGGLVYALGSPWLIARLGETGLMRGGAALFALGMLSLGGTWWPAQALCSAATGMGFFMLHNTLQTQATQMAPEARGTAIAAFAFSLFAGQSAGVALAGILVAAIGYAAVLKGSALLLLLLAVVLSAAVSRRQRAG
jgi:predicted MFS family arabinose efflux permease